MDLSVTSIHPSRMITKASPRQSPDMQWVVHKSVVLPMSTSDLSTLVLETLLSTSALSSECCPDGLPLYPSTLQVLQQTPSPKHTRVLVLFLYLSARQIPEALHTKAKENYLLSTVGRKQSHSTTHVKILYLQLQAKQTLHTFPTGMDLVRQSFLVQQSRELQSILLRVEISSASTISMSVEHIIITPVLLIYSTESAMVLLLRQSLILGSLLTTQPRSFKTTEMINSSILSRELVATTSIMDS